MIATAFEHRGRRQLLAAAAAVTSSASLARAAPTKVSPVPNAKETSHAYASLGKGLIGYMLAHEQFSVRDLVSIGSQAAEGGFHLLATSDHFQPWQANEGHAGEAWVTMGALSTHVHRAWMGTTVTCPILRYSPAVVAEAFASLSHLAPGRYFSGRRIG
jgi:hypothetical protein